MKLSTRLRHYVAHPDPRVAACNRIALLVAGNQPFYPFYLRWAVGGDWRVAFWTLLSTPLFLVVPFVARRRGLAGRMLLPLAGIANTVLSLKAFGAASGVGLFLVPCALIAILAFSRAERRWVALLLAVSLVAALAIGHLGAPIGHFGAAQYRSFRRMNLASVAMLSVFILVVLMRASRGNPPSTPSR